MKNYDEEIVRITDELRAQDEVFEALASAARATAGALADAVSPELVRELDELLEAAAPDGSRHHSKVLLNSIRV